MFLCIFDMNNIIPSMMSFTMCHDAHSSNVVSSGNHCNIADIEFNEPSDLGGFQIKSDGVAYFDGGVGVADGAGIVGDEVGHSCLAELDAFNFAEFVFCFFGGDAVDRETAFDVVDEAEVFTGLVDGDDV